MLGSKRWRKGGGLVGGGRYSNREGRPVEPDESRARGNDPDAVEICDSGSGDGPRRVGEFREEREGVQGRTEGDEHLADRDAEANWGTSEAGRARAGSPPWTRRRAGTSRQACCRP